MQVDPIKPKLKAPRIKRLKLQYDEPLSKIAFKFNLRHYTSASKRALSSDMASARGGNDDTTPTAVDNKEEEEEAAADDDGRDEVGRCRLNR